MEEVAQCPQRQCYRVAGLFILLPKTPFGDGAHLATWEKELMLVTVPDLQITFFFVWFLNPVSHAKCITTLGLAALYLAHYSWVDFVIPHINNHSHHEQLLVKSMPLTSAAPLKLDSADRQPSRAGSCLCSVPQALQKEIANYKMWQLLGCGVVDRRLGHPHFHLLFLFNYFVT